MDTNTKQVKTALLSVMISAAAVAVSSLNLMISVASGRLVGSAVTIFCCMIAVFVSNITIYLSRKKKNGNSSK